VLPEAHSELRSPKSLGFNTYIADPADQVIGRLLSVLYRHHLDRISIVVRPQNQVLACDLDVPHSAALILIDCVHVGLALEEVVTH